MIAQMFIFLAFVAVSDAARSAADPNVVLGETRQHSCNFFEGIVVSFIVFSWGNLKRCECCRSGEPFYFLERALLFSIDSKVDAMRRPNGRSSPFRDALVSKILSNEKGVAARDRIFKDIIYVWLC